jgi:hypothetical protein
VHKIGDSTSQSWNVHPGAAPCDTPDSRTSLEYLEGNPRTVMQTDEDDHLEGNPRTVMQTDEDDLWPANELQSVASEQCQCRHNENDAHPPSARLNQTSEQTQSHNGNTPRQHADLKGGLCMNASVSSGLTSTSQPSHDPPGHHNSETQSPFHSTSGAVPNPQCRTRYRSMVPQYHTDVLGTLVSQ